MKIGRTIGIVRKYFNLSQAELADKLKMSRSYLCEIEADKKTPSMQILLGFERATGVHPHELLGAEYETRRLRNPRTIRAKVYTFLE